METQLGPGESPLSCCGLQHKHNNDGGDVTSDLENSHGQLEMLVSPASFSLAVMSSTQRPFRGMDSLLCVLTLIHGRVHTFTHNDHEHEETF